jgi:hypothetical protein
MKEKRDLSGLSAAGSGDGYTLHVAHSVWRRWVWVYLAIHTADEERDTPGTSILLAVKRDTHARPYCMLVWEGIHPAHSNCR